MPLRYYIPLVVLVGLIGFVSRGSSSDRETLAGSDEPAVKQSSAQPSDAPVAVDRPAKKQVEQSKEGKKMKETQPKAGNTPDVESDRGEEKKDLPRTKEGWEHRLTPEQYQVTRCSATEAPFTGEYWDCKKEGVYRCVCCGEPLFDSTHKYQSGTGWPSFYQPVDEEGLAKKSDRSHGMTRTEVVCSNCGAHLGHVFPDGPQPSGLRYCINSAALNLDERKEQQDDQGPDDATSQTQ